MGLSSWSTSLGNHVRRAPEADGVRMYQTSCVFEYLAAVIVVKHIDKISILIDITFEIIIRWMNRVHLKLAKHKMEAVLNSSRKVL